MLRTLQLARLPFSFHVCCPLKAVAPSPDNLAAGVHTHAHTLSLRTICVSTQRCTLTFVGVHRRNCAYIGGGQRCSPNSKRWNCLRGPLASRENLESLRFYGGVDATNPFAENYDERLLRIRMLRSALVFRSF